jgi:hypothetical protein
MKSEEILQLRMQNQQLLTKNHDRPDEVVGALAAVQAQDFLSAKYAIGVRLENQTDADIETAIRERTIVRTWLMRGTLQLVAAEDIRWLLSVFGPRVLQMCASRYKRLELNEQVLAKCHAIFREVLHGGVQLTREALAEALAKEGIDTSGADHRLAHIFQHASYHQLICAGSRQGNQYTFTLLDDHVPASRIMDPDEALGELAKRYFTTRGPATLKDFMWWTGLSATTLKKGIERAGKALDPVEIAGETHWLASGGAQMLKSVDQTLLLPAFDEYVLAYRNRSAVLDPEYNARVITKNGLFNPVVVQHGKVTATWKRTIKKSHVELEFFPFRKFTSKNIESLEPTVEAYGKFLEKPVKISL